MTTELNFFIELELEALERKADMLSKSEVFQKLLQQLKQWKLEPEGYGQQLTIGRCDTVIEKLFTLTRNTFVLHYLIIKLIKEAEWLKHLSDLQTALEIFVKNRENV